MRLRAVGAKVPQNVREWVGRHGDLEQVVEERDDGVVGTGLAAEVQWCGRVARVDDARGEHGLAGDAEDEGAVAVVVSWQGVRPHRFHGGFDARHGAQHGVEAVVDGGVRAGMRRDGVEEGDGAGDQWSGLTHHVHVREDEARLGAFGVEAVLEGADESEIVVSGCLEGWTDECIIIQGVGICVGHKGWYVEARGISV